jgi:hypothetical protein
VRPGEVKSDRQAFDQILGRLKGEVGELIRLVYVSKNSGGYFKSTAPFWSLVRMMFPIAEAVGDLIYRNDKSTVLNLHSVLQNEFEAVRQGYRGKSNILAQLYRHSLTHHDEVRSLQTGGKECVWWLSFDERSQHLQVARRLPRVQVRFDTTAFYDDLIAVCHAARSKRWNGDVKKRYNGWLTYDLDAQKQKHKKAIAAVIAEIAAL